MGSTVDLEEAYPEEDAHCPGWELFIGACLLVGVCLGEVLKMFLGWTAAPYLGFIAGLIFGIGVCAWRYFRRRKSST